MRVYLRAGVAVGICVSEVASSGNGWYRRERACECRCNLASMNVGAWANVMAGIGGSGGSGAGVTGSSVGECESGSGGECKVESGMGGTEGASAFVGWLI